MSKPFAECPKTSEVVKSVLLEAKETALRDRSTNFGILDEEPITFTLILEARRQAHAAKIQLQEAVAEDICTTLSRYGKPFDRAHIRRYVDKYLVVVVKEHRRTFESEVSGADFGVVVELPVVTARHTNIEIQSRVNGMIIQAKRNFLANRPPERFELLSTRKKAFDYDKVRHFLALGLYRFQAKANGPSLSDVTFVPRIGGEGKDRDFVVAANAFLKTGKGEAELGASDFFNRIVDGSLGTHNRKEVEEFIF